MVTPLPRNYHLIGSKAGRFGVGSDASLAVC
jgi:hypothetical protein